MPDLDAGGYMSDVSLLGWSTDHPETESKELLVSINGANVISLYGAYGRTVSPENWVVPEHITDIRRTFDATIIRKPITVTINSNPTQYEMCFKDVDMSMITLAGSCSRELKQLIANTGEMQTKLLS